jgi:hypothetical protein
MILIICLAKLGKQFINPNNFTKNISFFSVFITYHKILFGSIQYDGFFKNIFLV